MIVFGYPSTGSLFYISLFCPQRREILCSMDVLAKREAREPESIKCILEDQAFLLGHDLARPPPSPVSKLDRRYTGIC
jgi:hypothetical protein